MNFVLCDCHQPIRYQDQRIGWLATTYSRTFMNKRWMSNLSHLVHTATAILQAKLGWSRQRKSSLLWRWRNRFSTQTHIPVASHCIYPSVAWRMVWCVLTLLRRLLFSQVQLLDWAEVLNGHVHPLRYKNKKERKSKKWHKRLRRKSKKLPKKW